MSEESLPYTPGSETSQAAAVSAAAGASRCRRLVLRMLWRNEEAGLTHEELVDRLLDWFAPSGIRTRCKELVRRGLVESSGRTRRTSFGKASTVWVITRAGIEEAEILEASA